MPQPKTKQGEKGFEVMEMSINLTRILEEEISNTETTLLNKSEEVEKVTGKRLLKNVIGS
jgi:hypothetical protein